MGLKKKIKPWGLDDVLSFGMYKGCTIREVIKDGQLQSIEYYIDKGIIKVDDDVIDFMFYAKSNGY